MTMHVNLSKEMEAWIKSKVATGRYGNATEVLRDAVRRMQDEDARIAVFQAMVDEGEADIAAGRIVEWTPDFMDRVFEEAVAEAGNGKPADADVRL